MKLSSENNWLSALKDGVFSPTMRLHWTKPNVLGGTWQHVRSRTGEVSPPINLQKQTERTGPRSVFDFEIGYWALSVGRFLLLIRPRSHSAICLIFQIIGGRSIDLLFGP
jgi:hypothetical protein